jgi:hypothetical protein
LRRSKDNPPRLLFGFKFQVSGFYATTAPQTRLLLHQGFFPQQRDDSARSDDHRAPPAGGSTDVQIEILYCGVCHSDLHFARNEWGFTQYPVRARPRDRGAA